MVHSTRKSKANAIFTKITKTIKMNTVESTHEQKRREKILNYIAAKARRRKKITCSGLEFLLNYVDNYCGDDKFEVTVDSNKNTIVMKFGKKLINLDNYKIDRNGKVRTNNRCGVRYS